MFRIITALLFLALSITFGSATFASAEETYDKQEYFKLYGGLSLVSIDDVKISGIDYRVKRTSEEAAYGFALGQKYNEDSSVELALDYYQVEYTTTVAGNNIVGDTEVFVLFVNRYHHFDDNFYYGGGIGFGNSDRNARVTSGPHANLRASDTDVGLAIQGVLGFQLPITETVDWDSNFRYVLFQDAGMASLTTGLRFNF